MEDKTYEQMQAEFKEFYFNRIKPGMADYEKARKEGAPKIILFKLIWFSIIFAILSLCLSEKFEILLPTGIVLFIVGILSGAILGSITKDDSKDANGTITLKTNFENDLKQNLMKDFLRIFSDNVDWRKWIKGGYFEKVDSYRKANIFNPFPYVLFDDIISLDHKSVQINIFEINTSIFNGLSVMIIPFLLLFIGGAWILLILVLIFKINKLIQYAPFKGIVVELNMNKSFNGHTFFLNKSITSKKIPIKKKKYNEVRLESIDFMNKYEVFSTDQVEARYILTPALIERLEHLKLSFKANYIRGSFENNKLILAIETGKDMFAMGNDFKSSDMQTFKELFNEIVSILKIIDQLKLDEKTCL